MKKLQLREGAYYRRRDGYVVGPMVLNENHPLTSCYEYRFSQRTYRNNGNYYNDGRESPCDILREVTKSGHPIRPTPKNRIPHVHSKDCFDDDVHLCGMNAGDSEPAHTPKKRAGGMGMVVRWMFTLHLTTTGKASAVMYQSRKSARTNRAVFMGDGYRCSGIVPISLPAPKASPDATTPKPATKAKGMTK